jgi:predicted amidohydrolase YtcJ
MSFADLVLQNGPVITMDGNERVIDAVAVKDGIIIAAGSKSHVKRLIGPMTEVVDLDGRAVTPGLVNAHDHLLEHGISSHFVVNIRHPVAKSIKEMLEIIGERIKQVKPGKWVKAQNWDEALLEENRYPTRYDLDTVSPDNPVWTRRVFHMCCVNSKALEIAGITKDTPDPPVGWIQKDENGEPTGILRGTAQRLVTDCIPEHDGAEIEDAIKQGCIDFNEVGFTTVVEPGLMEDWINAYNRVYAKNELTVRMLIQVGFLMTKDQTKWAVDNYSVGGDDRLRIIGLKMAIDGGVGPRSAMFYKPYQDRGPEELGVQSTDAEELKEMILMGHKAGFQVGVHAIGDRAIDVTLDAYEHAIKTHYRPDHRHQLIHGFFPTDEANKRIVDLDMVINTQTPFLYLLGDSFIEARGLEACKRCMPIKTWQSMGIPVSTSHDATVTLPLPHIGIYGSVARKTLKGQSMGDEEAISVYDALKLYTTDAAKQCFMEDMIGSIEIGKFADFAVWNFNPMEVETEKLLDWRCQMTFLHGERIYEAEA